MPITFDCAFCRKSYTVRDDLAGRRVRCKRCQAVSTVPDPDAPRAEADEPDDVAIETSPRPSRPPAVAVELAMLPLRMLARLGRAMVFGAGVLFLAIIGLVAIRVVMVNDWRGLFRTQAQADALAAEEWPRIKAESEAAQARASQDAGPTAEEEAERRKHRRIGWKGGVERLIARDGLPGLEDIPAAVEGWRFRVGDRVVLADDFEPGDPLRDVMLGAEFDDLAELFKPGLDHLARAAALAREDRIFAVPRGTIASVIEVRSFGLLWDDHDAIHVQLGRDGETAWVPGAHCR